MLDQMEHEFGVPESIEKHSLLMVKCCGRFSSRSRRFQKLLRKSEASLHVELDIRKFIQR